MKIILLFTLPVILANSLLAMTISDAKYETEEQTTVVLTIGDQEVEIPSKKGKYWSDLTVTNDGKMAFMVKRRGSPKSGSWIEDLHAFSVDSYLADPKKYELKTIKLQTKKERAVVMKIFDSSPDGSRLLISLHYAYEKEGNRTSFRQHPYFLKTADGTLEKVKP